MTTRKGQRDRRLQGLKEAVAELTAENERLKRIVASYEDPKHGKPKTYECRNSGAAG